MCTNKLESYLDQMNSPASPLLQELYRHTWLTKLAPRMASGPLQGKLLAFICRMMQPKRLLEIGTFTAYATLAMAEVLPKDAEIITIEANEEFEDDINYFIKKGGFENQIKLIIGDAKQLVHELEGEFDLIYLDADKISYPDYYLPLKKLLRSGGILLADNVLWGLKVLDNNKTDRETAAINRFNEMAAADQEMEQLILPIRDGLSIIRKK